MWLAAAASSSRAIAADAAPPTAPDLLRQLAAAGPGDCDAPLPSAKSAEVHEAEDLLFRTVDDLVAERLNRPPVARASEAASRAGAALLEVERSSAEIDKGWPAENRFHFQVVAVQPAILVRMSYRDTARFVLFGAYFLGKDAAVDPGTRWREVSFADPSGRPSAIDLIPLHRGPSGRPRFLAKVWRSGCAGSIGEQYYGYEWSAEAGQLGEQILSIEGAEGLDPAESKHVGTLRTSGRVIQLPYCFFSAVDTWDNPTLCAADSFDLSGDAPRFVGRIYNLPDLAAVNNAIRHAQARDLRAVRAYCASDVVARKLVRDMPPYLFADRVERRKTGRGRETILFQEGAVSFDLVRRRGEWLLAGFRIAADR
ncbi:MAG: hypothetical protein JO013_14880 [Alphaproteobacteria bacterium]|nr:hypothetical protein [Alphaproteobacteria bacterium]